MLWINNVVATPTRMAPNQQGFFTNQKIFDAKSFYYRKPNLVMPASALACNSNLSFYNAS